MSLRESEKNIFANWENKDKVMEMCLNEVILRRKMNNFEVTEEIIKTIKNKLDKSYEEYKQEGPSVAPWFVICVMDDLIRKRAI